MAVWWFIHLFILTFRLAFPFVSLKMDEEGKFRIVYWIALIIGTRSITELIRNNYTIMLLKKCLS